MQTLMTKSSITLAVAGELRERLRNLLRYLIRFTRFSNELRGGQRRTQLRNLCSGLISRHPRRFAVCMGWSWSDRRHQRGAKISFGGVLLPAPGQQYPTRTAGKNRYQHE